MSSTCGIPKYDFVGLCQFLCWLLATTEDPLECYFVRRGVFPILGGFFCWNGVRSDWVVSLLFVRIFLRFRLKAPPAAAPNPEAKSKRSTSFLFSARWILQRVRLGIFPDLPWRNCNDWKYNDFFFFACRVVCRLCISLQNLQLLPLAQFALHLTVARYYNDSNYFKNSNKRVINNQVRG